MGLLGTMYTTTTYGTWLRGDWRGWVEDGKILPFDPKLQAADRQRMKHSPFRFEADQLHAIGAMIGASLQTRLRQRILALTVQNWHVHLVVAASAYGTAEVMKCAKEAVRYGLRPGRPIWTDGYDKRYCFDEPALFGRIHYVERHNTASGLSARPWDFIEPYAVH